MRKIFIASALVLLIIGAVLMWRKLHPPLTDEQQIAAALDGITAAAGARSPRGIADFLAKDFQFGNTGKSEFQNSLVGGILQYRVIDLRLASTTTDVNGSTAKSEGRYILSLKSEFTSSPEVFAGKFVLKWRKDEGQWLVIRAQGEQTPG